MPDRVYNVLFLCTGNSARSILGEALLNRLGGGHFKAYSAGSHPRGQVHPMALELLTDEGLSADGLRSKPWDEFSVPDAPVMDFVFTVCDDAAGEVCPIWPGHPMTAHWGIEDPAAVVGTPVERRAAFVQAFRHLRNRISTFVALPVASLDRMTLQSRVRAIGSMHGASQRKPDVA